MSLSVNMMIVAYLLMAGGLTLIFSKNTALSKLFVGAAIGWAVGYGVYLIIT